MKCEFFRWKLLGGEKKKKKLYSEFEYRESVIFFKNHEPLAFLTRQEKVRAPIQTPVLSKIM
jgi:hypothetical protein